METQQSLQTLADEGNLVHEQQQLMAHLGLATAVAAKRFAQWGMQDLAEQSIALSTALVEPVQAADARLEVLSKQYVDACRQVDALEAMLEAQSDQ